jgi:hypothetical protein
LWITEGVGKIKKVKEHSKPQKTGENPMYTVTIYDIRTEKTILKRQCATIDEACDTRQAMIDSKLFSIPVWGMIAKIA